MAAIGAPNGRTGFAIVSKTVDASLVTCARDWVSAIDVTVRLFCFLVASATTVSSVRGQERVGAVVVVVTDD